MSGRMVCRRYLNGIGTPRNLSEAKAHFLAGHNAGHVTASFNLGIMYYNGWAKPGPSDPDVHRDGDGTNDEDRGAVTTVASSEASGDATDEAGGEGTPDAEGAAGQQGGGADGPGVAAERSSSGGGGSDGTGNSDSGNGDNGDGGNGRSSDGDGGAGDDARDDDDEDDDKKEPLSGSCAAAPIFKLVAEAGTQFPLNLVGAEPAYVPRQASLRRTGPWSKVLVASELAFLCAGPRIRP